MSRPDVFPSVDCSPVDSEVEVVHVRGMKKCRRRGRAPNSESSDVTSVGKPSSLESGYRSVPEGASSTPIVSSDVSNDSLTSVCSCPCSVVTSPPPSGPCSAFGSDRNRVGVPVGVSAEFPTETPSIVTRTAAEDELIRSILEDHCKSFCHPAVITPSTSSSVDGSKHASTKSDVPTSTADVSETSLSGNQYTLAEETTPGKLDVTRTLEEENDPGELENVAPVIETGLAARKPSVAEDEVSIYDDAGSAAQRASVHETSVVTSGFSGVVEDRHSSSVEPVSWLSLADTDSVVSDTKLSRTSSVSSSSSLETLAHCAEVRYRIKLNQGPHSRNFPNTFS